MSVSPAAHLDYLRDALAAAEAAPLSQKKARLAALLIDAHADRLFAARAGGDGDILAWRAAQAELAPALAAVFALAGGSAKLVIDTVDVPLDDYPALSLPDFMVSLYSGHTVQRVRIVLADGTRLPAHSTLRAALADLVETDVPV